MDQPNTLAKFKNTCYFRQKNLDTLMDFLHKYRITAFTSNPSTELLDKGRN